MVWGPRGDTVPARTGSRTGSLDKNDCRAQSCLMPNNFQRVKLYSDSTLTVSQLDLIRGNLSREINDSTGSPPSVEPGWMWRLPPPGGRGSTMPTAQNRLQAESVRGVSARNTSQGAGRQRGVPSSARPVRRDDKVCVPACEMQSFPQAGKEQHGVVLYSLQIPGF